jgi:hypothetical protein
MHFTYNGILHLLRKPVFIETIFKKIGFMEMYEPQQDNTIKYILSGRENRS